MIFQPIMPWWLLVLLSTLLLVLTVYCLLVYWKTPMRWSWARRVAVVLLLITMIMRPSLPGASRNSGQALLDICFVIDSTYSSTALDYNGNKQRLEGMINDAKNIAEELVGARFSVIVFDNKAMTALPLTTDTTALANTVETIQAQPVFYSNGSSIDAPLELLQKELQRIAESNPDRGRVVFYFGDGEQTANTTPKSFSTLKNLIGGGAVLGYGTSAGGKMREYDWGSKYSPMNEFVKDYSTEKYPTPDALSKLDEPALRLIADQAGLHYINRNTPTRVTDITDEINVGHIIGQSRDTESYSDAVWLPSVFVVALTSYDVWRVYITSQSLGALRRRRRGL